MFVLSAIAGCRQEPPAVKSLDYARELPPGQLALRKIPPEMYPNFDVMQTDRTALLRSIDQSLVYLDAPTSQRFFPYLDITHARAVATLRALRELASSPTPDWNGEIRRRFDVYQSVGAPQGDELVSPAPAPGYSGQVLFTGYFTPIYAASLTRTGPYQWPLYKRPGDLVSDETGEAVYRRAAGGPSGPTSVGSTAIAPVAANRYWTRAEIEQGGKLRGQELVWLSSRWEAYVVTVQGSARLKLTDGHTLEIGFHGTNGHAYVSPGRQMLADGVITRDQLSLKGLGQYFAANPEKMDRYLSLNPRTTFFTERPGGPFGKLNVPVTAFATVATDKDVYPRAMPAFLVTSLPTGTGSRPFGGFMLDQDAGGAIRSAGRADIYMGVGPVAEQSAGRQLYPGKLFYLAVR
ncbi:MltA domain-containing protein [Humisphaera borealis]|uniref:peptidoglycan lytic exotransglycosylase n=1 Tax=Humisphaera borealis TaxID=2807512 RepID=A0A7M2X307_9BACT|nr:MltA domain-containing protein [Humisphaera borealis]QOV92009.1 MltA domain-containing protein [Humisphaera borealis]